MNHDLITDYDVIGQYRRGELATEDAEAFEEHLLVCPDCRALLAADFRLERGLRAMASGAVSEPQSGLDERVGRTYLAIAAVAAMLAIAGVLRWQTLQAPMPHAGLPVFQLVVTRGSQMATTEIRVPSNAEWFVLELDAPAVDDCCRVVIEDGRGEIVWESYAEIQENDGVVRILLGRNYLHAGSYRIALLSTSRAETRLIEHQIKLNFES